MKDLLELAVRFDHQASWNPKMTEYVFAERNGIYPLDLGVTVRLFGEAEELGTKLDAEAQMALIVGTEREAQDVVVEETQRRGKFYASEQWLGEQPTNCADLSLLFGNRTGEPTDAHLNAEHLAVLETDG